MFKNIANSFKVKVYTIVAAILALLLILFAIITPITQKGKTAAVAGGRGLAVADTLSVAIAHYGTRDIVELRKSEVPNQIYQGVSGLLYNTAQKADTQRIFAIYKGVGGKYFYILDSGYNPVATSTSYAIPSQPLENSYLKSKSLLDRISSNKQENGYSDVFKAVDGSYMVTAYSAVKDKNGEVAAIIGVDSNLGTAGFSKYGFLDLTIVLIVGIVLLLISFVILFFIFKGTKKNKDVNKKSLFTGTDAKDIEVLTETILIDNVEAEISESENSEKTENSETPPEKENNN